MLTIKGDTVPSAPDVIERGDREVSFIWHKSEHKSVVLSCRHQRPVNKGLRNGMYIATLSRVERVAWRSGRDGPRLPAESEDGIIVLKEATARYNPQALESFSIDAYAELLRLASTREDISSMLIEAPHLHLVGQGTLRRKSSTRELGITKGVTK